MTESTVNEKPAAPGATPESEAISEPPADQQEGSGATPDPTEGESDKLATALKAERDARRKAEADLRALQQKATEGLSETELLTRRVAELEAAKTAAEREALVLKIATEFSIPTVLASRLHGSTEDELRADAESLKNLIPAQQPANPPTTVGGPQGAPVASRSPEEWLSVIRKR